MTSSRFRVSSRLARLVKGITPAILPSILLVFMAADAVAVRQYRCAGKIQYRPCTLSETHAQAPSQSHSVFKPWAAAPAIASATRMRPPRAPYGAPRLYAAVRGTSLSPGPSAGRSARDGIWRGLVEGNGMVQLHLEFLKQDEVFERRLIGNIPLVATSTSFAFVSRMPSEREWTWRIAAQAMPLTQ